MFLKRLYSDPDPSTGRQHVTGVRVLRATRIWRVAPNVFDGGDVEGWLTRSRGTITIHGEKGDVVYRVANVPGLYCCHCDARLGDVGDKGVGLEHVAAQHAGVPSPDPENPAGYRGLSAFECVLVGDEIEDMTREEAVQMVQGVRTELARKLKGKYGDSRGAAERRLRTKTRATQEG